MIYALWNGGPSYAPSDMNTLETFASVREAKDALLSRERRGYCWPQEFKFADGETHNNFTPCVQDSSMDLYLYDPREVIDPYPDRRLTIGPHGGVRTERC